METKYADSPAPASLSYPGTTIMRLITFFSTGVFIVVSACIMRHEVTKDQQDLYDVKWSLKKIHTGPESQEVTTRAFIKFNKEKGSAGGNAGCNSFGSTVTVSNNNVIFQNIFSTKMYCEGIQATENSFLNNLEQVTRFDVKNKTLRLYRDKELLLEFQSE